MCLISGALQKSRRPPRLEVKFCKMKQILLLLLLAGQGMGEILFDRVKPIIWLKTKSTVSLGVTEYDINFAYTDPCTALGRNIKADLPTGQKLSEEELNNLKVFESNCKALYILEWSQEVKQLIDVRLPTHPVDHMTPPKSDEPYSESIANKEAKHRGKRDVKEGYRPPTPLEYYHETFLQPIDPEKYSSFTRKQILYTRLVRFRDILRNASVLDKTLTKITLREKISKRETKPDPADDVISLPPSFNWWEIALSIGFWPYSFLAYKDARERAYTEGIKEVSEEIRKMLDASVLDQFTKELNKVQSLTDPMGNRKKRSLVTFDSDEKPLADIRPRLGEAQYRNHREKRGIVGTIAGEVGRQAVGAFTGNIVSNLLTIAIEYINPYSNTNRLGRLEAAFK